MQPQLSTSDTFETPSAQDRLVQSLLLENERLQAELNEQRERAEIFQSVFNCLPDAMIIAAGDRTIRSANPGVAKIFGYSEEEIIGKETAVLYENFEEFEAQGRARFNRDAQGQLKPYEVKYRRKNGDIFTGETVGTPLRDGNGDLLGFLGAIRDVTDRERAHKALSDDEKLLRLIAGSLPELVAYVDADHTLQFVNSTAVEWYNRPREEIIGRKLAEIIDMAKGGTTDRWMKQALAGDNVRERTTFTYPDGKTRMIDVAYVPDIAADGRVLGFVSLVIDVTRQVKNELELEASKARFTDAISAIPDGFAYYDEHDRLQIFNEQYRKIYTKSADLMVLGATFEEIIRGGVARGQYKEAIGREEEWIESRIRAHRNPGEPLEQQLQDGRWLRIEERKTRDGGIVGIRVDITQAKEREILLEQLAVTDPLTGLSNRRSFFDKVHREHEKICSKAGAMSFLLIDVDHFKHVNDTYGHAVGDQVLRELAGIIVVEIRGPDAVCRYGGEEFAVFLADTSMGGAFSTAERIRAAIEDNTFHCGGEAIRISVSIGGTQSDARDTRYEDALARADKALYRAKDAGRNRVMIEPLPT